MPCLRCLRLASLQRPSVRSYFEEWAKEQNLPAILIEIMNAAAGWFRREAKHISPTETGRHDRHGGNTRKGVEHMQDTGQVPEPASEISEAEKRGHAAVEKLLAELDAEEHLVEFVRKQQEEQVSTSTKAQIRRQRRLVLSNVTKKFYSYFQFGGRYGTAPA